MLSATEQNDLLLLVDDAAVAVMTIYDSATPFDITTKADDSPVTNADMAAHRILSEGLAKLHPNIAIVSEEGDEASNAQLVSSDRFWLVDPVDGTKEFIAKSGEFAICVALMEHGVPVFGIMAAPAQGTMGETYFGGPAMGSFKRLPNAAPSPLHVATQPTNIVMASRTHSDDATGTYIADHYAKAERKFVGSQLKFVHVAAGLADAYPRLGSTMKLWDVAAGQAIVNGAGGRVVRPDGSAIDYGATSLLAGDFIASA